MDDIVTEIEFDRYDLKKILEMKNQCSYQASRSDVFSNHNPDKL